MELLVVTPPPNISCEIIAVDSLVTCRPAITANSTLNIDNCQRWRRDQAPVASSSRYRSLSVGLNTLFPP